jgi:hypothetical protein
MLALMMEVEMDYTTDHMMVDERETWMEMMMVILMESL